jgi:flagellar protein FlaI
LIEYESNFVVIGGTGSGKTSLLNSLAFFIPPQARIVSIEDTHELALVHENWLPSVARQATGIGAEGSLGEVDLFALLKESFRQRPDYVIVGEIRGKEAFVLFQGAASGHATACTMHAEDVDTMVKRLETPPISLSPALIEIIDVVCIMGQVKVQGDVVRRLKSIVEVIKIEGSTVKTNTPFLWDPQSDTFFFKTESVVFQKIIKNSGMSMASLQKEFTRRTQLLMELYRRNITDFRQVQEVIDTYYKTPEDVMRRFNIV